MEFRPYLSNRPVYNIKTHAEEHPPYGFFISPRYIDDIPKAFLQPVATLCKIKGSETSSSFLILPLRLYALGHFEAMVRSRPCRQSVCISRGTRQREQKNGSRNTAPETKSEREWSRNRVWDEIEIIEVDQGWRKWCEIAIDEGNDDALQRARESWVITELRNFL